MAKGKSANPADAFRKAQRKKELKKASFCHIPFAQRAKAREFALVKKDTRDLEDEIEKLEARSDLSASEKSRLTELKSELEKIMQKKEEYVKEHPEHRKLVFKSRRPAESRDEKKEEGTAPKTRNLFRKNGLPRHPERSVYYDPVYNPYGVPPPGMPYVERPLLPTEVESEPEESDDDDIVMPEGPPPEEEESDDSDDDIPMPEGPPPPKPGQQRGIRTAATTTAGALHVPAPGMPYVPPPPPVGVPTGPSLPAGVTAIQPPPPPPQGIPSGITASWCHSASTSSTAWVPCHILTAAASARVPSISAAPFAGAPPPPPPGFPPFPPNQMQPPLPPPPPGFYPRRGPDAGHTAQLVPLVLRRRRPLLVVYV
ncbi:hypothetical protein NUW54_g10322 [Trametes sanguinea]|uniref:Uncharacterized protein n=1 Tax=Trametes sanguinea TaxID=158606 RepID=A0ACC1P2J2_9APHY|nr:hypothetical protein NUW54_g10322 [Trametes sanguinea]